MNRKTILFASLLLGGLPLMGTLSADAAVRDTISINQGWQFHRGDVKNIAELKSTQSVDDVVNLPHDFLIGQDWVAPAASRCSPRISYFSAISLSFFCSRAISNGMVMTNTVPTPT